MEPREESLFFEGYGPAEIDPVALVYYRYERIVEDLGEIGKSIFLDPRLGEQARGEEVELAMSFFVPGGDIDRAETVSRRRWPSTFAGTVVILRAARLSGRHEGRMGRRKGKCPRRVRFLAKGMDQHVRTRLSYRR